MSEAKGECPIGRRETVFDTFTLPEECQACFAAALASAGVEVVEQPNTERRLEWIADTCPDGADGLVDYSQRSIQRHGAGPKRTMTQMDGKRNPAAFDAEVITTVSTVEFDCLRTEN